MAEQNSHSYYLIVPTCNWYYSGRVKSTNMLVQEAKNPTNRKAGVIDISSKKKVIWSWRIPSDT